MSVNVNVRTYEWNEGAQQQQSGNIFEIPVVC